MEFKLWISSWTNYIITIILPWTYHRRKVVWLNYDLILHSRDAVADSVFDRTKLCTFWLIICSTWKFMVFVHAKIGELKVKDLSQKLQGISGFIFHLQLCEGQQLKHQILLKSNTEWVIIHPQRVEAVVPQTHTALTAVFVSNQERKAAMDHSHVSVWSTRGHGASQRECGSVNCFFFFFLLSHQKPFNVVIHHLLSWMCRYFPGAVHQEL